MFKKLGVQFLMAAVMMLIVNGELFAQKATRINFRRGTSSASVSGTLRPGASRTYVLRARANQEIQAVVSGKNVVLDNGMLTMSYSTPSGDNFIEVINKGRTPTRYTMTVSIQ